MAFLNIPQWSVNDVVTWIKGVDSIVSHYVPNMINNNVTGSKLMMMTCGDLIELGVKDIGHQEIILNAIKLLRHVFYESDRETVQKIAMDVCCAARGLESVLPRLALSAIIPTDVLLQVRRLSSAVKYFISWLDRSPYDALAVCRDVRDAVIRLGVDIVSVCQHEVTPTTTHWKEMVMLSCRKLYSICDNFVKAAMEPVLVQPPYFDEALLSKDTSNDVGIDIQTTCYGI